MRHIDPKGEPAVVIERALTLLVDDLERRRMAKVKKPLKFATPAESAGQTLRYVRATVRRAVWTRDEGRGAFVGTRGRCQETAALEFHHVEPFAFGRPTTVENLHLRCRAHTTNMKGRFCSMRGPTFVRISSASADERRAE